MSSKRSKNETQWIWTAEGWLHNPALTEAVLENDRKLRDMEAELEARLTDSPYQDYLIARALVNELSASYEIELEHLDRKDIYAAAIDLFQLRVPPRKDISRMATDA